MIHRRRDTNKASDSATHREHSEMTLFTRLFKSPRKRAAIGSALLAMGLLLTSAAPAFADFGIASFDGTATDSGGNVVTQAGSHPRNFTTSFTFNKITATKPDQNVKDIEVNLPPGIVGNPSVTPKCTFETLDSSQDSPCPANTQVGFLTICTPGCSFGGPLYNMVPRGGAAAQFATHLVITDAVITVKVRTGSDYGLTASLSGITTAATVVASTLTMYGVPADQNGGGGTRLPFLNLPTSCLGPQTTTMSADSWQNIGDWKTASFVSHDLSTPTPNQVGYDGCASLDFSPTLSARPTTNAADAPSGLDVDVHTPQNQDPDGTAEANLKDTTVTLPPGLTLNPSAANGLGSCSEAEFGYTSTDPDGTVHTTPDPATCPDSAKLGTAEIDTPLVDHPLPGSIYLAKPIDNPFGSMVAIYVAVNDPQSGVVVKLAGETQADPNTGRLTTTFKQSPQLPFEHFHLNFFGGSGGILRTPAVCGNYSSDSTMTPWTSPDQGSVPYSDPWSISQGANGGSCSNSENEQPNSPSLDAGTVSAVANNYSPLVLNLSRPDGSQQFKTVTLTPPPGLLAKLAGIPACSEAGIAQAQSRTNQGDGALEQSSPSCPDASKVGTVDVAAGAGPAPFWAKGNVYMAGPYNGAPLSFVIITPAVAGPFDLGVVVTHVALNIDPTTAQITAVSDPIPDHLTVNGSGFPLDVTQAKIRLDRDQFIHTGTSCDPSSFSGSLLSTLGQSVPLSQRFQLGECSSLPFKPRLGMRLRGGHFRNGHPAFTSVLTARAGDANIGKVGVTLPPTMQLDQSHIQAPCTRPQFAAGQCPAASVIGSVVASSPLLDYKLRGPVYLRTGNNPLPDVVLALHGPASQPIEIDQVGKIDTVHARLRTTFQGIPDAPLSKAIIRLVGGHKGLLVNNTNLCKQPNRAAVFLNGQNNKIADSNPHIALKCPKPRKKHHRKHKRHHLRNNRAVR